MALGLYLNFAGNCREAVDFYADVFGQPKPKYMTYGDMPPDPTYTVPEANKNLVMNTALTIRDTLVMFSDVPPEMPMKVGDNVSIVIVSTDQDDIKDLFQKLGKGGTIQMELQQTFWSPCYGMLTDGFGIKWQLSYDDGIRSV